MLDRRTPRPHLRGTVRSASFAGSLLTLGLVVSACGGSAKAEKDPTPSPSSSAPTSATPSPTPTATPLSSFEDRPEVKVARAWLAATAQDINDGRALIPHAVPYETTRMRGILPGLAKEDLGSHYPGPPPFTPVNVLSRGRTATVSACNWTEGWAQDPKTKKPTKAKKIEATNIFLVKQGGTWKVNKWQADDFDCGGVAVTGVGW